MLALVCPGQGSQSPGFLSPWLDLPGVQDQLEALSEAAGIDLVKHGTVSDAATIKDTAVAQPLIVAASLVTARLVLQDHAPAQVLDVTAGHSVGEFAAAAVAGVLQDGDAVALVTRRASAMADAAALEPTGMSAVVGGETAEVLEAIGVAKLHAANVNGAGQIVAAGDLEGLARLANDPPPRARVVPLEVAGAFHTPYMAGARDVFGPHARGATPADPVVRLLSDADGKPYPARDGAPHGRGREVLDRLTEQIVAPVRWDLCQATMAEIGVRTMIEVAPAGVLTGLARRSLREVRTVAVKTPDDLALAREVVAEHAHAATSSAGDLA
ncbi:ACP S-malonyltransferase [Cellulomonas bogoriensis]|uniref:[acyl-carrier-protein] S-malonyltransferase n=1 Tax=Cellulomonas bogoriensis 69B4 = DSM 16987 TaxID=1386082 RepID=A0A0A0C2W2_9CELL|nr:ACP S-malonyltransferase [Cellulomonas bogoriensis]KGM14327.1 ACP S-malonyltransferase [Cellulomonas bogoriensis 69B4 = DSM 16987]